MKNLKNDLVQFYKHDFQYQFSRNLWLDLLCHGLIGLTIGMIIYVVRDVKVAPLLCTAVTMLHGLRNHLKEGNRT